MEDPLEPGDDRDLPEELENQPSTKENLDHYHSEGETTIYSPNSDNGEAYLTIDSEHAIQLGPYGP